MANISLETKGFKKMLDALDPRKFRNRLQRQVLKATLKNGLLAERAIVQGINRGRVLKANAPLTQLIKGSDRPLVNTGQLLQSINHRILSPGIVVIGVLRKALHRDSQTGKVEDITNVAAAVHEGFTVTVTQKMRNFFAAMSREFPGEWFPLKASTKLIVVPARPFLWLAVKPSMIRLYKRNWENAIDEAFRAEFR